MAGVSNIVLGKVNGIQMAGISNTNIGNTKGIMFGGIINTTFNGFSGFQGAGIANSKKFSWDKCYTEVLDFYTTLEGGN